MSKSDCCSCQENWKKPDKSIKLVVRKRVQMPGNKSSNVLKARSIIATDVVRTQLKRNINNPFSCSPRKKPNITRPSKNLENVKLFNDLDKAASPNEADKENIHAMNNRNNLDPVQELKKPLPSNNDVNGNEVKRSNLSGKFGKKLPLDWSLKTRVRFTSPHPFSWCSKLLGNQEARGTCNFVQCKVAQSPDTDSPDDSLHSTHFQQNIMYWVHPVLPWLSLFPRLSSEIKLTSKVPSVNENDDITEALQTNWCKSFRSLFNLLRCGHCDYFYLCSSQSTMLFRAACIGGMSSMSVLITPTTKGIREAFDNEGIQYSLPALNQSESSSFYSDDEDKEVDNVPLISKYDNQAGWLESMGVGEETLPQLKQSKLNQQRVQLRNIDHQGSSVAVITGSHTQALFNYLLNCKSLVAKTGQLAGIPPTLLAPVAFEGATLQPLSTKQGMIKQGKLLEQRYNLDINGPILPGMLSNLCQLFEITQHNQFAATAKVLQATAPFNVMHSDMRAHQPAEKNEPSYLQQSSELYTTGISHITYEHGLYSWERR